MIQYLRNALKPDCYHGRGQSPPFFEGWYFKLVDGQARRSFAIIPGIFLAEDPADTHAFVQVVNGTTAGVEVFRYPAEAFSAMDGAFDIHIGLNRFSTGRLALDIKNENQTIRGELSFLSPVPWPVTLISPGIMGWYAWMPFMECYHGVVSLDHGIEGELRINDRRISFDEGRGYTEKDWGRSFPSSWIWLQCNHFQTPGSSFTGSVAIIPWIGSSFPGFIIGLWHQGKLYRFATYTGAKIRQLDVGEKTIRWVVEQRRQRLEINIERPGGPPALLHAPTIKGMTRRIEERLNATVNVQLSAGGKLIFRETGQNAGLEVGGEIERLIEMWKRQGG